MNLYFRFYISVCLYFSAGLNAQHVIIPDVPDNSQPPGQTLASTLNTSNYCSPFAALNIIEYWEHSVGHAYANGVTAGLPSKEVAEYIGWFMDTNDNGSPHRLNGTYGRMAGTYTVDQEHGFREYIEYDSVQAFGFPYTIPVGKRGTGWDIMLELNPDFMMYCMTIDEDRPVKVDFSHWNISPAGYDTLLEADSVHIYKWGEFMPVSGTQDDNDPLENWNDEEGETNIGHAVTGVGYLTQFVIPGSADPPADYLIVHDNWGNTPENIAIPWYNVRAMLNVRLPIVPDLAVTNIRTFVDSIETDSLNLYEPVMVGVTIKNQTIVWVPPFILVTSVLDDDGVSLITDTSYFAYSQNKQMSDSTVIYLDSLFTPTSTGNFDINSKVFWDMNADSIINDPPDANPVNDVRFITRAVGYNIIYTSISMIPGVPDLNQPPTTSLSSTIPGNFCAPMATANILLYWDIIAGHTNAAGVTAALPGETFAEYIGWFFDTNNQDNPAAANGTTLPVAPGTYIADQDSFLWHIIRWDTLNPYMAVAPALPAAKVGYDWQVTSDHNQSSSFYEMEINAGRPVKLDFMHWNISFSGTIMVDSARGDTAWLYQWGNPVTNAQQVDPAAPEETWNLKEDTSGIGHAVTGVGYINHGGFHAIVHDNWQSTHKTVCVPWNYWTTSLAMDPTIQVNVSTTISILPDQYRLNQNYPNPFNHSTVISWQLPISSNVKLSVFNLLGQKVSVLVSEKQQAGHHKVQWDAGQIASGVYYYLIEAENFRQIRKMLLMK